MGTALTDTRYAVLCRPNAHQTYDVCCATDLTFESQSDALLWIKDNGMTDGNYHIFSYVKTYQVESTLRLQCGFPIFKET